jgi:predicted MPP superfamily phosphohydrolase
VNNLLDVVLILIFSLVQWKIARLVFAATGNRVARIAILAFSLFAAVSYTFTFSHILAKTPIPTHIGMVLGAGSLAYFMTATVMLIVRAAVAVVRRALHAETNPGRRQVINAAGNVLMAAPFAVMGYGALVQRTDFRVREVDMPIPGLPEDLAGLRILQLSDVHLGAFLSENEFARVVDACNELRPQLAVMTGDLISGPSDPLDQCIRQLARVKSDAGMFGCMGNHERYAKAESYTERECARLGMRFLRARAERLKFGQSTINLAGTDFEPIRNRRRYLAAAKDLVFPGAINILLQHNPDVFPAAARLGYNLLLAGHTHGGQVTVEILDQSINPARFFTPFVYGAFRQGTASAYVTRGIGTIGVPARIGAPPEITLLRLRKA